MDERMFECVVGICMCMRMRICMWAWVRVLAHALDLNQNKGQKELYARADHMRKHAHATPPRVSLPSRVFCFLLVFFSSDSVVVVCVSSIFYVFSPPREK